MPAAELNRLQMQIDQLVLVFHQPQEFSRRLGNLFSHYGDHAYRAGKAVKVRNILPNYRVPPLVTRQLALRFGKLSQQQPQQALDLLDVLWQDRYLEPRLLAVAILGSLPVSEVGSQVVQKLREWGKPEENLRLFNQLMEDGTLRLRREAPKLLLDLIQEWVESPAPQQQAVGLRALGTLLNDRTFDNLPFIYRLVGSLTQAPAPAVQTDLMVTLQALARRSPVETVFFLRQVLSLSNSPLIPVLVRRCLSEFSLEQQTVLRAALETKKAQASPGEVF